ncbi:ATP-dependent RNA helicase-like protein [Rhizodiscina lignyota]|uniref:RNA helicase n=1 Tax=Rhizodiscina lignyota TaxID=1504668 RepID=A0A9P4I9S3_9PEZI|nr:ATP-dependent RNA helicase-like protein [Rhizodiscina lignyota]
MPNHAPIQFDIEARSDSTLKFSPQQQNKKRKREHEQPPPRVSSVHQNGQPKKNRQSNLNSSLPNLSGPNAKLNVRRQTLLPIRKQLPIWSHQQEIRQSLRRTDVLVLSGETGSGKSTQVPQFLLTEQWCNGRIAVTQPRRVAAISLARRVAEEMGTPLGSSSPASRVGYSVRFDNSTSANTRIKYLTEGMLLQELLRDPALKEYSAVIVDEIHERSVNVDLILGFLRNLLTTGRHAREGKPLKVVIMSATVDTEKLVKFFDEGYKIPHLGSSESPVQSKFISTVYVEGRQYPVSINYLPEPTNNIIEMSLKTIFQTHYKEPLPGDILIFLPGQEIIENLERQINELAANMEAEVPKMLTLPLFAALPQAAQQRIFQPAPPRTRKIILSTNIAETSVTVPGIRHVVDCGTVKMKYFHSKLGLEALLAKPISQSAAIQRKGRAGREAPGKCYRLYPESEYVKLDRNTRPEILRCDLSQAILIMKARGVNDVLNFPLLDPPPQKAMEKALLLLLQLGALNGEDGSINEIGQKMAKLPLTPTLARVIVEAAKPEMDCLEDVIDVLACLSVENIFLNPATEEKREAAEAARKDLFRREGDHITLLSAVRAYTSERTDRREWAEQRWISHRAMQNVMNVRKQLHAQCKQLGFLSKDASLRADSASFTALDERKTDMIIQCLTRGFLFNTAALHPDGSYRTLFGKQTVAIHPSSVLFGRKVEAIVFSEFVFTTKAYARGVSAVSLAHIDGLL